MTHRSYLYNNYGTDILNAVPPKGCYLCFQPPITLGEKGFFGGEIVNQWYTFTFKVAPPHYFLSVLTPDGAVTVACDGIGTPTLSCTGRRAVAVIGGAIEPDPGRSPASDPLPSPTLSVDFA